jgi:hypothetical protein
VVRLAVFFRLVLRRHGLDGELQVLAVGIENFGNARPWLNTLQNVGVHGSRSNTLQGACANGVASI